MLQIPRGNDLAVMAQGRIATLDRARTVITLLVVLHHLVINCTPFGHGDRMRWLGFDLVEPFNDSFFMACMFFHCSFAAAWCADDRQISLAGAPGDWVRHCFLDLHPDAGCPLSDLPALPFTGNNGLQFPSFLVAHADDWSLAVRVGVVLVGVRVLLSEQ